MSLNQLRDRALAIATSKGFTEATPGEEIALIHSELSEALEDIRDGKPLNELSFRATDAKPSGVPSEMADVIIRVLHFCGKHGIDIEHAVKLKMDFNETRPYKHGRTM